MKRGSTLCTMLLCLTAILSGNGCSSTLVRKASTSTPNKPTSIPAAAGRGVVMELAPNVFRASCDGFGGVRTQQQTEVWCWAACAEMVHKYNNRTEDQASIAKRLHGMANPEDPPEAQQAAIRAGSHDEIIRALVPEAHSLSQDTLSALQERVLGGRGFELSLGGYVKGQFRKKTVNSDIMVDELLAGEPLVVGLRFPPDPSEPAAQTGQAQVIGHACVIYSAVFSKSSGYPPDITAENVKDDSGNSIPFFDGLVDAGRELVATPSRLTGSARAPFKYDLREITIMDPWYGAPETITADAFAERVDFMISGREAREIVESSRLVK